MVIIATLIVTETVCIYDFIQWDAIAHGLSGSMCSPMLIIIIEISQLVPTDKGV